MNPDWMLGVAGDIRAGKTTVAQIIAAGCGEENCCIAEGSIILEDMLQQALHPTPKARSAQQALWTQQKEKRGDPGWLTKKIKQRLEDSHRKILIFLGLRTPPDVELIQSYPRWMIFYVTAPFAKRLSWAQNAARKDTGKTDEHYISEADFARMHRKETEQFSNLIKDLDGVQVVHNTGTFRDLGMQIISALLTKGVISTTGIASRKDVLEELYLKLESQ